MATCKSCYTVISDTKCAELLKGQKLDKLFSSNETKQKSLLCPVCGKDVIYRTQNGEKIDLNGTVQVSTDEGSLQ